MKSLNDIAYELGSSPWDKCPTSLVCQILEHVADTEEQICRLEKRLQQLERKDGEEMNTIANCPTPDREPSGLEMVTSEEIDAVWGRSNFGPTKTRMEVVKRGVLQYACDYPQGYTAHQIIAELGLVTKSGLTLRGKRCLWLWFGDDKEGAELIRLREENLKLSKQLTCIHSRDSSGVCELCGLGYGGEGDGNA